MNKKELLIRLFIGIISYENGHDGLNVNSIEILNLVKEFGYNELISAMENYLNAYNEYEKHRYEVEPLDNDEELNNNLSSSLQKLKSLI